MLNYVGKLRYVSLNKPHSMLATFLGMRKRESSRFLPSSPSYVFSPFPNNIDGNIKQTVHNPRKLTRFIGQHINFVHSTIRLSAS